MTMPRRSDRSRLSLSFALAVTGMLGLGRDVSAQAVELAGAWSGALSVPGATLRLVFHLEESADGWTATMDSPDQGARGIPGGAVNVTADSLTLAVPSIGGSYRARIAGDSLKGEWSQGGQSFPLDLVRGAEGGVAPAPPPRPQHPEPPFPYEVEEVRYPNPTSGFELAGTLTRPQGDGPFPAVLLITGSGPQDRDEEVMGHKVFLVWADALTRRGIAVLRVDDRGVGGSTGDFAQATSADFATDVEAGLAFLRAHPAVDAGAVGLVGHSEGGLIAPMVAARDPDVAFVVLLAGPGIDGTEVLVGQTAAMQRAIGVPEEQIEANGRAIRQVAEVVGTTPRDEWPAKVRAALMTSMPPGVSPEQAAAAIDPQVATFTSPWMAYFLTYDPRPALEALEVPVLALNGALDVQVLPEPNLAALRAALAHNRHAAIEELPALNHLFQPAETGQPDEYSQIEMTVAPAALTRVADWILAVVGVPPGA